MPGVHHISHALDARDGGISVAVAALVEAQRQGGLDPRWLAADQLDQLPRHDPAATLLHLHGLWRRPTRRALRWQRDGFPRVIAPHGMLDPGALAISRRRKQLVWRLWERRALASADCLQALCPAEAAAIRSLLPRVPIALIPNGVGLPARPSAPPPWLDRVPAGEPVLLFLGRFHRKKGIEPLLTAWQAVAAAARRSGWWLALVGYGDDGALAERVAVAQARGDLQRLLVLGPLFGADKEAALSAASAFVLPSRSEGLPMAALEAMAHRRPCLLSGACNLPQAFTAGAALPAEPNPAALAAALQRLFALSPAERAAMGAAGEALVRQQFSWPEVAEQTRQLYGWILGGGTPPGFVEGA